MQGKSIVSRILFRFTCSWTNWTAYDAFIDSCILTSGSQGVNAAVIRAVLDINPSLLTVLLPQSLDKQLPEIKNQLESVMHLVEKSENDDLPLPMASSLCNQEIINRCDQLICFAFHDSETLLNSCRCAEEMGKVVSLLFFD